MAQSIVSLPTNRKLIDAGLINLESYDLKTYTASKKGKGKYWPRKYWYELWLMLPDTIIIDDSKYFKQLTSLLVGYKHIYGTDDYNRETVITSRQIMILDGNIAEALAQMLLWLHNKKLLPQ
jgi:hypothetical protein